MVATTQQYDRVQLTKFTNPYTFTGRRFDPESGLYYYRARYYDAKLGRFLSRDPIGFEGSEWNLYEYLNGMPLRFLDPSGLDRGLGTPGWVDDMIEDAIDSVVDAVDDFVDSVDEAIDDAVDGASDLCCGGCVRAAGASALTTANTMGVDHTNNASGGNAFRHCMATCNSKKLCGDDCAEGFWDGRETPGRPADDMDLANNQVGYGVADSGSNCLQGCLTEWNSGNFTCLENGREVTCPAPSLPNVDNRYLR